MAQSAACPLPKPPKGREKAKKVWIFFKFFAADFHCGYIRNTNVICMKKTLPIVILLCILSLLLFGCNRQETLLDPKNPVTLTMWHVYGEQVDSPMNGYVEDFNRTVGKQKGIIVNVTLMSNASQIGQKLINAQMGVAGVPSMPDLFFCHNSNAQELGAVNLLNWKDAFSTSELAEFVDEFVTDGVVDNSLSVLPVSKSTHLLFLAGGAFSRFATAKNVSIDDLSTWDGFFDVAQKYFEYSHGKPFCAVDYLMRSVELDAISQGRVRFLPKRLVQAKPTLDRILQKVCLGNRQRAYRRVRPILQHAGDDGSDNRRHILIRRRALLQRHNHLPRQHPRANQPPSPAHACLKRQKGCNPSRRRSLRLQDHAPKSRGCRRLCKMVHRGKPQPRLRCPNGVYARQKRRVRQARLLHFQDAGFQKHLRRLEVHRGCLLLPLGAVNGRLLSKHLQTLCQNPRSAKRVALDVRKRQNL